MQHHQIRGQTDSRVRIPPKVQQLNPFELFYLCKLMEIPKFNSFSDEPHLINLTLSKLKTLNLNGSDGLLCA